MAKSQKSDEVQVTVPDMLSPEWNDYLMSQFVEEELVDGHPLVAGLRRLAEQYVGVITKSMPTQVFPVQEAGFGRATVVYQVEFLRQGGIQSTFADVADVWPGNVDDKFAAFAVAIAATRAEARALRKALKLRTVAAEELSTKVDKVSDEVSSPDIISANQVGFIDTLCKKLNINVVSFINGGERAYRSVNQISRQTATKMIQELNRLQNNISEITDDFKGYTPNWQENFK